MSKGRTICLGAMLLLGMAGISFLSSGQDA